MIPRDKEPGQARIGDQSGQISLNWRAVIGDVAGVDDQVRFKRGGCLQGQGGGQGVVVDVGDVEDFQDLPLPFGFSQLAQGVKHLQQIGRYDFQCCFNLIDSDEGFFGHAQEPGGHLNNPLKFRLLKSFFPVGEPGAPQEQAQKGQTDQGGQQGRPETAKKDQAGP